MTAGAAQAEEIIVYSTFSRIGTATGVGEVFGAGVSTRVSGVPSSLVRPNGSSTWDFNFEIGEFRQCGVTAPIGLGDAGYKAWMADQAVGAWQVSWAGLPNPDWTFDTSTNFVSADEREYLSLTAASSNLFDQIKTQGLVGTFTFHLTAPYIDQDGRSAEAGIVGGDGVLLNGSSFQLTITEALQSWQNLTLSFHYGIDTVIATGAESGGTSAIFGNNYFFANTVYGVGAVPAPGAAALLGLAGLAGRRRRR
jgi:MYXO-CTERM domain-containing protein